MAGRVAGEHRHVSVFAGLEERFVPGLSIHPDEAGWAVHDALGELGEADRHYGIFATEKDACREALRLLRARHGPPLYACWGAGSPNEALRALGYERGSAKWRWWPPGYVVTGGSEVGLDGGPVPARTRPVRWPRLDGTIDVTIDEVEGFGAIGYPPGARRVHRRLFGKYAKALVLRGGSRRWSRKPVAEAELLSPEWFQQLRVVFTLLVWILERAPGIGPVRSLRFENPPSGSWFLDEDTAPVEGDVVEGAIRRVIGGCMENGTMLVNGHVRLPFSCDCLGRIALFVVLPSPGKWLDPADVERQVGSLIRTLRVPVDLRVALDRAPGVDAREGEAGSPRV